MTGLLHALAIFPVTAWLRFWEWRDRRRAEHRAIYLSEGWREERWRLREME